MPPAPAGEDSRATSQKIKCSSIQPERKIDVDLTRTAQQASGIIGRGFD
jgi:hypothetical protein